MYAKVDDNRCCGYTTCHEICPEVFLLDDAGFAYVEQPEVPEALREKVEEAARSCAEGAIRLTGSPD
ncbi:ferredoxin [Streptomyces ipomoeae]|nr:ferredoxin [Streptomyces ipomoeae]